MGPKHFQMIELLSLFRVEEALNIEPGTLNRANALTKDPTLLIDSRYEHSSPLHAGFIHRFHAHAQWRVNFFGRQR